MRRFVSLCWIVLLLVSLGYLTGREGATPALAANGAAQASSESLTVGLRRATRTPRVRTTPRPLPAVQFPLPPQAHLYPLADARGTVIFRTSLTPAEVMRFYRQTLRQDGARERRLLTNVTDTTFSMVFDSWAQGGEMAVVVQGVVLSATETVVSIRLERV